MHMDNIAETRERCCARCLNHGNRCALRGHKPYCPFVHCLCADCETTKCRQSVMASSIKDRRQVPPPPSTQGIVFNDKMDVIPIVNSPFQKRRPTREDLSAIGSMILKNCNNDTRRAVQLAKTSLQELLRFGRPRTNSPVVSSSITGKSTDPIMISYQDRIGQAWDRTGIGTRKDLSDPEIKTVHYQLRSEQRNPEQRIPGESTGTLNNIISRPEQYIPEQITGQVHIISGPGQYIPEHRSHVNQVNMISGPEQHLQDRSDRNEHVNVVSRSEQHLQDRSDHNGHVNVISLPYPDPTDESSSLQHDVLHQDTWNPSLRHNNIQLQPLQQTRSSQLQSERHVGISQLQPQMEAGDFALQTHKDSGNPSLHLHHTAGNHKLQTQQAMKSLSLQPPHQDGNPLLLPLHVESSLSLQPPRNPLQPQEAAGIHPFQPQNDTGIPISQPHQGQLTYTSIIGGDHIVLHVKPTTTPPHSHHERLENNVVFGIGSRSLCGDTNNLLSSEQGKREHRNVGVRQVLDTTLDPAMSRLQCTNQCCSVRAQLHQDSNLNQHGTVREEKHQHVDRGEDVSYSGDGKDMRRETRSDDGLHPPEGTQVDKENSTVQSTEDCPPPPKKRWMEQSAKTLRSSANDHEIWPGTIDKRHVLVSPERERSHTGCQSHSLLSDTRRKPPSTKPITSHAGQPPNHTSVTSEDTQTSLNRVEPQLNHTCLTPVEPKLSHSNELRGDVQMPSNHPRMAGVDPQSHHTSVTRAESRADEISAHRYSMPQEHRPVCSQNEDHSPASNELFTASIMGTTQNISRTISVIRNGLSNVINQVCEGFSIDDHSKFKNGSHNITIDATQPHEQRSIALTYPNHVSAHAENSDNDNDVRKDAMHDITEADRTHVTSIPQNVHIKVTHGINDLLGHKVINTMPSHRLDTCDISIQNNSQTSHGHYDDTSGNSDPHNQNPHTSHGHYDATSGN